jgi:hypothetical protein
MEESNLFNKESRTNYHSLNSIKINVNNDTDTYVDDINSIEVVNIETLQAEESSISIKINDKSDIDIDDINSIELPNNQEDDAHSITDEDKQKMINIEQSLYVNPFFFHYVTNATRFFFLENGFIETYEQSNLSVINSCKHLNSCCLFDMYKFCHSLPQSNEIWLDYEITKYNNQTGFFCISTHYTNDSLGIKNSIIPCLEFSIKGGMFELEKMLRSLLTSLGYKNKCKFNTIMYKNILSTYNVTNITPSVYNKIAETDNGVIFIKNYTFNEDTFWNDFQENEIYNKITILLDGKETITATQKSKSSEFMRNNFKNRSDFNKLCEIFGEYRVLGELEGYLELPFSDRCTGKINLINLIGSMHKESLIPDNYLLKT